MNAFQALVVGDNNQKKKVENKQRKNQLFLDLFWKISYSKVREKKRKEISGLNKATPRKTAL